jgi:hypothetical protein
MHLRCFCELPGALEYNAHLLALNKELELNPQDAGLQVSQYFVAA